MHRNRSLIPCDGCRNAATHEIKTSLASITKTMCSAKYASGKVAKRPGNWCDSCDPPLPRRGYTGATHRQGQVVLHEKTTGERETRESSLKTRTIAGHKITLTKGVRYIATRPMAERGRKVFPVVISKWPMSLGPTAIVTIPGLSYEAANKLVNAFNNGDTSSDGRVW